MKYKQVILEALQDVAREQKKSVHYEGQSEGHWGTHTRDTWRVWYEG